jgi:glycoside/pentoside/hexuronide:cation symporter, GPH family
MREPAEIQTSPVAKLKISRELSLVADMFKRNGPLVRIFLVITTISIALTMFGKNVLYFFKYDLERPDLAPLALALPGFLMLIAVPFWVILSQKTSKRFTWMVGSIIALSGYLAFYLVNGASVALVMGSIVLISLGGSAFAVMFWSMLPDTVEYGQAQTGIRQEARVFGFASFAMKAALGFNALLLGILLEMSGYVANQAQNQGTLDSIRAMMTLIPALGVIVSVALLWRYPIDGAYHADLRRQIAAEK